MIFISVLAIRGTFSLADVIVDVICDEEKYLDGYAHRGILKGSQKIMKEAQGTLELAFQTHPDHKLVITGHSLGAGTAVLITMKIKKSRKMKMKIFLAITANSIIRKKHTIYF